jgi:NAD(P)-dependent dehydrogenase (short-subunit alcohol dehydrogenase family)
MNTQKTESKIVIITGGSRGLGRNMALFLADQGRDIILTYRSKETEAKEVVSEIEKKGRKAVAIQLDTSKVAGFNDFAGQVASALKAKWNRSDFDFLINNAGTGLHAPFSETTEAQFDDLMNVHFKGVFFLTQKLLPMIRDHGRILNISSGLARFSLPGSSAYASMKGGVETLTKYLAKELGSRKISVNVLAPGAIETDFNGGLVRDNPALNQTIAAQTALGRVGLPEDIGGAVAALLSDDAYWITGQRIEASGGMFL